MGIFDTIKARFKQKDVLIQLIVINVCVFAVLAIFNVVTKLFKLDSIDLIQYIGVPANLDLLLTHAWTLFTYMFVHEGVLHILFNMLLLYWFGQIFLSYFNHKNLGSLYVLGGLAGAAFYILAFNTIPMYKEMPNVTLIGASASVMAVIFAAAFYNPQAKVSFLLIGQIKIIYIAIFFFVLDFISLADPSNPGGHVAHIGGAVMGYIFAKQYLKGKDFTRWISRIIDWFANIFKPNPAKPKMKVKYNTGREQDYEYNKRRQSETEEIDHILDKIKASGYSSLNDNEKKRLFDASKK